MLRRARPDVAALTPTGFADPTEVQRLTDWLATQGATYARLDETWWRELRSPALERGTMRLAYHARNLTYRAPLVQGALRAVRRSLAPLFVALGTRAKSGEALAPETKAELVEHYSPSVRALEELLGRKAPWPDFARPGVRSAS